MDHEQCFTFAMVFLHCKMSASNVFLHQLSHLCGVHLLLRFLLSLSSANSFFSCKSFSDLLAYENMSKFLYDSSLSFSRRYSKWGKKQGESEEDILEDAMPTLSSSSRYEELKGDDEDKTATRTGKKKRLRAAAASKLRSVMAIFHKPSFFLKSSGLGTLVVGTLFGFRRGHVHFAFQENPKLSPVLLIELATPTSVLVTEMASGLVRIALECDKKTSKKPGKLLDEPIWKTYCNGKKCGYAMKRDCGAEELKILKVMEPISTGAGVFPGNNQIAGGEEGDLMYMRAKFERVVGSKDSEAFYMMNPDSSNGPELSFYLLRV